MSLQRMGAKKIRALTTRTGLDIQMAWTRSDPAWCSFRTYDDRHYDFNRQTGELEPNVDDAHNTSCPGHACYDPAEWTH